MQVVYVKIIHVNFNTKLINATQAPYNVSIDQGAGCFGYGEGGIDLTYTGTKESFTTPWCGFNDTLSKQGVLPSCKQVGENMVFSDTNCQTGSPSYLWNRNASKSKTPYCFPSMSPSVISPTSNDYNVGFSPTMSTTTLSKTSVDMLCLGNMGAQLISPNSSALLSPFNPVKNPMSSPSQWLQKITPPTLSAAFKMSPTGNTIGLSVVSEFGTYSAAENKTAAGPCVQWANLGTTFPVSKNIAAPTKPGGKIPMVGGAAYCKTALGSDTMTFCPFFNSPTGQACATGKWYEGGITTCKPKPSPYCGLMQTGDGWAYPPFVPDGYALVGQTVVPSFSVLGLLGVYTL